MVVIYFSLFPKKTMTKCNFSWHITACLNECRKGLTCISWKPMIPCKSKWLLQGSKDISSDHPVMILACHCHMFSKCLPSIINSNTICASKQKECGNVTHIKLALYIKPLLLKTSKIRVHIG